MSFYLTYEDAFSLFDVHDNSYSLSYYHPSNELYFKGPNGNITVLSSVSLQQSDTIRLEKLDANKILLKYNGTEEIVTDNYIQNVRIAIRTNTDNVSFTINANSFTTDTNPDIAVTDSDRNWLLTKSYDNSGKMRTADVVYFDCLAKPTQVLSRDFLTNRTWASETRYDIFGRPALESLSAPLDGTSQNFTFEDDFILQFDGTQVTNTELEWDPEKPPVLDDVTTGTLGWYYGVNNSIEPYQDNAFGRPYSRTVFDQLNPGNVRMISGGKIMDLNGDGDILDPEDGFPQGFSYEMPATQELYYAFGTDYFAENSEGWFLANNLAPLTDDPNTKLITHRAYKTVVIDVNGNEVVSFSDLEGNVMATARSGGPTKYEVVSVIGEQGYIDVHIPTGILNSDIQFLGGTSGYNIWDIRTGDPVPITSMSGGHVYRIEHSVLDGYKTMLTINSSGNINHDPGAKGIRYKVNYFDYSLNYHDTANNLKKSIQPLGFDVSALNLGTGTPNHGMSSLYTHNALKELNNTSSPDEGSANFIYREDGQIRFSRNSKQLALDEFSYTNYDNRARPIESGVSESEIPYFPVVSTLIPTYVVQDSISSGPGTFTKIGVTSWNDSGIVSNEATGNGNFVASFNFSINTEGVVGISETNADGLYTTIEYGLYFSNNQVSILSEGKTLAQNVTYYSSIDEFHIERNHNELMFKKNDEVIHQLIAWDDELTTFPSMLVDGTLYTEGAAVTNMVMSELNAAPSTTPPPPGDWVVDPLTCKEQTFSVYDIKDTEALQSALYGSYPPPMAETVPRVQQFVDGNVSKTYTKNPETNTTWFSYDVYGRVEWMVQFVNGLGAKTIDYVYDEATGEIEKLVYQLEDPTERFVHRYLYNELGQLTKVETSRDNVNFIEHARYFYYETGELKRVELAEGLQGIDYTYTFNGQLKAINHPGLNSSYDPGSDQNDAFGFLIDYHERDYTRTGSNINYSTSGNDRYDGNIKGLRWGTQGLNSGGTQNSYLYEYNNRNWLQSAAFGTVNLGGTYSPSLANDYKVFNLNYDSNGNILTLNRNKGSGLSNEMDILQYNYDSGTNQLEYVDDTSGNSGNDGDIKDQGPGNYSYNSIGQLILNQQDEISYDYYANGLVKVIASTVSDSDEQVEFYYDDRGHRIEKKVITDSGTNPQTYYVRDASGRPIAIYNLPNIPGSKTVVQNLEYPIYGESRLGSADTDNLFKYELADHLGNVRAVIQRDGNSTIVYDEDFNGISSVPFGWSSTNTTLSIDTTNERLKAEVTSGPSNSISIGFPVTAGNTYSIEFEVDLDETANHLEYVANTGGVGVYTVNTATENGLYVFSYTALNTGTSYLSFNLTNNYDLVENIYYLDNIKVTDVTTTNTPIMLAYKDYYPFGMPMPGRNIEGEYRYAYQGQEKDSETGMEAFELRLWDARIGRWLTTDPANQFNSPYLGMGNNPITRIDPDGGYSPPTEYLNVDTGERIKVNDGVDQLLFINDDLFQQIKPFHDGGVGPRNYTDEYLGLLFRAIGNDALFSGDHAMIRFVQNFDLYSAEFIYSQIDKLVPNYDQYGRGVNYMAEKYESVDFALKLVAWRDNILRPDNGGVVNNAFEHRAATFISTRRYGLWLGTSIAQSNEIQNIRRDIGNWRDGSIHRAIFGLGDTAFEWKDVYNNLLGAHDSFHYSLWGN
ncbi:MAG: RHS repeat-associated core domain-containing protein [Flavobacterium sp.]|nr:MAG: RHS repeat-associated core domain-containing protein [Flavobacterium sp.]